MGTYRKVSEIDPRTALGFRLVAELVRQALTDEEWESLEDQVAVERALRMIERRAK